ncbi:MAG: hypothetical protein Q4C98_11415 [Capnocytophaga sp.]|nr:hypothetical protein [Capnocytophaga sp.]
MNKLIKKSRIGVFVLVAIMLLTIPNMSVYPAVGSYQANSMALVATQDYGITTAANDKIALPGIAAGVALAIVAAVGFIDGWNSIHAEVRMAFLDFEKNYNKHDFSKFDN